MTHRIPCILFEQKRQLFVHMLNTFLKVEKYFQTIEIVKFMGQQLSNFDRVLGVPEEMHPIKYTGILFVVW